MTLSNFGEGKSTRPMRSPNRASPFSHEFWPSYPWMPFTSALQKTPIRSNPRVRTKQEMRSMLTDLKERRSPVHQSYSRRVTVDLHIPTGSPCVGAGVMIPGITSISMVGFARMEVLQCFTDHCRRDSPIGRWGLQPIFRAGMRKFICI